MSLPDPRNAHVRSASSRREAPDVVTEDAQRLLNDPAFTRACEAMREGLVAQLETLKHDGSDGHRDYELEICRNLRVLRNMRHAIAAGGQISALQLAGFKPVAQNED